MELMANRDQRWFYFALIITLLIHMTAISPLSKQINRNVIPTLSGDSMEIDLSEMYLKEKRKQKTDVVPPLPKPIEHQKKKIPPPLLNNPDPYKFKKLPEKKKELSPDVSENPPKEEQPSVLKTVHEEVNPETKVKEEGDKTILSPLFIGKKNTQKQKKEVPDIPQEIKDTFRKKEPEKTTNEQIQYSLNTYKWTFERYLENWAIDLQKWWRAPLDYAFGKVPEGGDIWIQARLERSGRLMGYTILRSNVTPEMELSVTQALIASFERPPMPEAFPEETLVINWRFIYPPLRPDLDLRR